MTSIEISQNNYGAIASSTKNDKNARSFFSSYVAKLPYCLAIFASLVFSNAGRAVIYPILSPIAMAFRSQSVLGYLSVISTFGRVLSGILIGSVSKYYDNWFIIFLVNISTAVICGVFVAIPSEPSLYFLQLFLGISASSIPLVRAKILENIEPFNRTNITAYLIAVQYAGFISMPLIGSYLTYLANHFNNISVLSSNLSTPMFTSSLSFILPLAVLILLYIITSILAFSFCNKSTCTKEKKTEIERAREKETETHSLRREAMNHWTTHTKGYMMVKENDTENNTRDQETVNKTNFSIRHQNKRKNTDDTTMMSNSTLYCFLGVFLLKMYAGVFEQLLAEAAVTYCGWSVVQTGYLILTLSGSGILTLLCVALFSRTAAGSGSGSDSNTSGVTDIQWISLGVRAIFASCLLMLLVTSWRAVDSNTKGLLTALALVSSHTVGIPLCFTALLGKVSKVREGPQTLLQGRFWACESLTGLLLPFLLSVNFKNNSVYEPVLIAMMMSCLLAMVACLLAELRK